MTAASGPATRSAGSGRAAGLDGPSWPTAGVLAAPALTAAALLVFPSVSVGEAAAAAMTFLGGALTALVPLAVASPSALDNRRTLALACAAVAALGAIAVTGAKSPWLAPAVNLALTALAHALGGWIGRRVQHPGHLLPVCVVAAAADFASVLHPSGPTHAIAESERALAVAAVGFPVPGTNAVAPVLGLGDLVFLALVFGVAVTHRLPMLRAFALGALGIVAAGIASAHLERAVPALVPIAAAIAAGTPAARRLRPEDRRAAKLGVAIALAVVVGVALQRP